MCTLLYQLSEFALTCLTYLTQWKLFCNFGKYYFGKTTEKLEKISQKSGQNSVSNVQGMALK